MNPLTSYRHAPAWRLWRILSAFMLFTTVTSASAFGLAPQRASAGYLGTSYGVQNDIVAGYGFTFETWVDETNGVRVNQRPVTSQVGTDDWRLGGVVTAKPTIGAKYNGDGTVNCLAVFARGTDGAVYVQYAPAGLGFGSHDEQGIFRNLRWQSLGGYIYGNPVAYGGRGFVGVAVTGNASEISDRYWQYTGDCNAASGFSGWTQDRPGVQLGTNLLFNSGDMATINAAAKADVSRVRLFLNNNDAIRAGTRTGRGLVSSAQMDAGTIQNLIDNGAQTIILNGAEAGIDWDAVSYMLSYRLSNGESIMQFAARNGNTMFYFEVGNEPDRNYYYWLSQGLGNLTEFQAWQMRWKALDTLNHFNRDAGYRDAHSNLRLMISMPTHSTKDKPVNDVHGEGPTAYADIFSGRSGATPYRSVNTWDDTYSEGGSSDGNVFIGKAYDAMGIHTYSFSCFDEANNGAAGEGNGTQRWGEIIRYYAQRGSAGIYITEAAINDGRYDVNKWDDVAARYVLGSFGFDRMNNPSAIVSYDEFGEAHYGGEANGRVKGVTFFQTSYFSGEFDHVPGGGPYYNIDEGAPVERKYLGHTKIGNRDMSGSDCLR